MITIDRKDLIDLLKGRVLRIQTKPQWVEFNELVNEVGLEWMGRGSIDVNDVWRRYQRMLGIVLNKDGRKYKISYMSYRTALTTNKVKEVITLDDNI